VLIFSLRPDRQEAKAVQECLGKVEKCVKMAWKILFYASGKGGGESKNSWSGKMVNEFERAAFAQEKEKSRPLSKQILDTHISH